MGTFSEKMGTFFRKMGTFVKAAKLATKRKFTDLSTS
jgi:hypothetical protein